MVITFDIFCIGCRYNLRGLRADRPCPECGTPAASTVYTSAVDADAGLIDRFEELKDDLFDEIVRRSGAHEDAVLLVQQAMDNRCSRDHASARELCLTLRDWAIECFGDEAHGWLAEVGLRSSEDIGRVVLAMVDFGAVQMHEADRAGFSGLYTLDSLFEDEN